MTMRNRIADESGWVLVTATVLTTVMLAIGLVAAGMMDADTRRTREQRERETALNLDEGVLYAQSLVMATNWPSSAEIDPLTGQPQYYPATCTSAGAANAACPNPQTLAAANSSTPGSALFNSVDVKKSDAAIGKDVSWATKVRDNGGALATSYDATKADLPQAGCFTSAPCTYDANKDHEMWVQSRAVVRGKPRNVVARLRLEELAESVPETAVVSGALQITNNGNHNGTPIINADGSQVVVRCGDAAVATCAQFEDGQIMPADPQSDGSSPNMMTAEQLGRFKQRALIDHNYFSGCPGENGDGYDLSGKVVWVEGCNSPPSLTNKVPTTPCGPNLPAGLDPDCVNTETSPGLLIWHCGLADMSGGWTYRGVLYIVNNSDNTCPPNLPAKGTTPPSCSLNPAITTEDAIATNGGFGVWGATAVDGNACLKLGSNGLQVTFDPDVFVAIESYGTVGLVQNTWRELDPSAGF
jgi:Tfp pilus assembly protein PilX